ncbi:polysaccharide biosynthesis/export family protein [Sphingomonas sp. KC8]|uniref:polysaccharide biosynthesis/export family protein n=1 Tax=Sphingomonas sp. KC8 TaxID=1030157 RepID=UPI000248B216|nr:polysaccharide biosynthesis/export family protein [Sphingomonas sp. KC8]ARS28393.1 capsule biosynthesis protein [Sphingomonas sp. KC8]
MHHRQKLILAASCFLGACSTLPTSGPTGAQIEAAAVKGGANIDIVTVDDAVALPPAPKLGQWSLPELDPPPSDMVGPGDVISIYIYEAGVPLFGGASIVEAGGDGFDPSVKAQTLPPSRVDDNGDIVLPYAGKLHVVGKTLFEVQGIIQDSLRGFSQDPQVLVTLKEVVNNSIIIGGEVDKPGRLVLQTNQERLSDVLALAGGYRGSAKDLSLRLRRGSRVAELRLSDVLQNPEADVFAYPGDRLTLLQDPWLFSVLGASGRVQQIPFTRSTMSLAEAVAAAGGPNNNYGDPGAIFVFRYEKTEAGEAKPVVYHFNMMRTSTYFLAQKFALHNNDVLYFGSAGANQPSKLIQLISQLFAPIVTVTNAANAFNNN